MSLLTKQQKGGIATAAISRKNAEDAYYKNPNYCLGCDAVIPLDPNVQVGITRRKKFCTRSCFARYNNKKRYLKPRRKLVYCLVCGKATQAKTGLCLPCLTIERAGKRDLITKGELHKKRSGYQSARSSIRSHAAYAFIQSGREPRCVVCGYDNHIDVCHIRAVKDFPDSATLGEINHVDNLVALCPNHHWELDNGYLSL